MKVDVNPADYQSAAEIFGTYFCDEIAACGDTLALEASLIGKVSGNDPTGVAFGQMYDEAAPAVLQAIFDLSDAGMQVAALLEQSGFNVALADAYSDLTGRELPEPQASYAVDAGRLAYLASASGGGIRDLPDGWELVQAVLTLGYPDGDTGKLRQLGQAWKTAASSLETSVETVASGVAALDNIVSPEIEDARFICQSLSLTASEIASHAKTIGESCVQFADQIDQVRSQINLELGVMLATIVALEVAAGLAAGPTAGVGTAALQVAVAGRVAAAGHKILTFLNWLLINSTFTRGRLIWSTKGAIEAGLKSILGKIPKKPGLTPVAPVTTLDATASAIAASSPWLLEKFLRGRAIEKMLGNSLPPNYPTFDIWNPISRIATSIKSINLADPTYQTMSKLRGRIKSYINSVANFEYAFKSGIEIDGATLTQRVLHVAIPEGATADQLAVFKEMAQYAEEHGVRFVLEVIP